MSDTIRQVVAPGAEPQPVGEQEARFVARHGYWAEGLGLLAAEAPEFFGAAVDLACVPWEQGTLAALDKALILVALNATPTNLRASALQVSIRNALKLGATDRAIMEVFQLVASLSLHSCTFGVPKLFDVLQERNTVPPVAADDSERQGLKDEFIAIRRYWGPFWDQILTLSPQFFKAYLRYSSIPWENGHIEPKLKELMYIAIDSNVTHLYEQGIRIHIANALSQGATPAEIMEVLQLMTNAGLQTFEVGLPILRDELAAARNASVPV